jgi:hypothetical protein
MARHGQRGRRAPFGIVLAAAGIAVAVVFLAKVTTFVSQPQHALRPKVMRHAMPKPAAPAEVLVVERPEEDESVTAQDEGMDDALELTPAEYKAALRAEIDREKSKNFVVRADGQIDQTRKVVPWASTNEKEYEATARERLAKDGIFDPERAQEREKASQDTELLGKVIGTDVYLEWVLPDPGNKVGYIVEKKAAQGGTFFAIASYEEQKWQNLLVKQDSGSQTFFQYDEEVDPGDWVYRVLVRDRNGAVNVVNERPINVAQGAAVDFETAAIVFVVLFVAANVYLFVADSQDGY